MKAVTCQLKFNIRCNRRCFPLVLIVVFIAVRSGSDDGSVRVWEVSTARCLRTLEVGGVVKSVAWNPNPSLCLLAVAVSVPSSPDPAPRTQHPGPSAQNQAPKTQIPKLIQSIHSITQFTADIVVRYYYFLQLVSLNIAKIRWTQDMMQLAIILNEWFYFCKKYIRKYDSIPLCFIGCLSSVSVAKV